MVSVVVFGACLRTGCLAIVNFKVAFGYFSVYVRSSDCICTFVFLSVCMMFTSIVHWLRLESTTVANCRYWDTHSPNLCVIFHQCWVCCNNGYWTSYIIETACWYSQLCFLHVRYILYVQVHVHPYLPLGVIYAVKPTRLDLRTHKPLLAPPRL